MIPLIPLSLAKSSHLAGTRAVNAKAISEDGPSYQRSTHKGAVLQYDYKQKVRYGRWR
jgi:hypothetical protein